MATDQEALILQMAYDLDRLRKQSEQAIGIVDSSSGKMVARSKAAAAEIEKSFGTIDVGKFQGMLAETAKLQDRLTAAQVAGNGAEAKAIREQIALKAQLQRAAVAQLETQLAIARATGNKAQVAQLAEALALQSQLSKFQAVGLTGVKALHEAEAAVVALAAAEKAAEGANVGKALGSVFDSSKLALVEEGSAKIRVFGSAIEPLGAYGVGAAVGIAALAVAAESARKAMEWADDLDRTAKKLGTTTTSLQQLDYASVATSIGLQQGRDALAQFNEKIGAFESHIRDKTMVKFADGIRLTRQEVQQTVDPIEKLRLVMEKLAKLPDAQQRTAAAKAFGLDGLLPIINEGTEGIEKFIGKMREAQANGSIVDPRTIREAAELNDKVEELSYRIGVDFKKAFIDAAPAIEKVAEFIERCTHALAGFLGEIPDAIRGVEALIDKLPHIPTGVKVSQELKDVAANAAVNTIPGGRQAADILGAGRELFRAAVEEGRAAKLGDKVKGLLAGKPIDLTGSDFDPAIGRQGAGQQLNFDKPTGSKHDETLTFDKTARDAYENGLKALIAAQLALTGDLQERADAEKKAVDADLTKKLYDLDVEEAKIRAAKKDAHKTEQLALIEKAKTEEQNAAAARKELIDRQTAYAIEDRTIELYKSKVDAQIAELQAQASIASTAQERAAIELRILALRQQQERDIQGTRIDRRAAPGGDLTPDQAGQLKGDLDRTLNAQADAQKRKIFLDTHPVAAYLESLKDVDREMQSAGVSAARNLSDGLADAIVNAHSLGDVASNVFRQLIAQLLSAAIQKDIAGPILAVLGFAGGGSVRGPGSSTSDSIPAMLSDGEFVVKASAAKKHAALLEAINTGRMPHLAEGGWVVPQAPALTALKSLNVTNVGAPISVFQSVMFDLKGSVLTDDLRREMQVMTARSEARAVQAASRVSRDGLPGRLQTLQKLGT